MSNEFISDLINNMIDTGIIAVNKKSVFELYVKAIYQQGKEDCKKEIAEKLLKELEE